MEYAGLLGSVALLIWLALRGLKLEEFWDSVKQSPIMVKFTRDMQIAMASRQNLRQVAAFMAGFAACMLISRTPPSGCAGISRYSTLRPL